LLAKAKTLGFVIARLLPHRNIGIGYAINVNDIFKNPKAKHMDRKCLIQIFKTSFKEWLAHNAPISAAALTFFIILPLPSLLLIVTDIFAQFYGQAQAQEQLIQQITSLAGPAVAQLFRELLASASSPFTSVWTAGIVVAFTVGGAIGGFAVLRDAMDVIWEVKMPKKNKSWVQELRRKLALLPLSLYLD
jgi:uncharacterized BrkB/YihY/UPF0761 family membrane protein